MLRVRGVIFSIYPFRFFSIFHKDSITLEFQLDFLADIGPIYMAGWKILSSYTDTV